MARQAGVVEGPLDVARVDVRLDEDDEDLARARLEEAPDDPELLADRLGAELAERVAEEDLALAAQLAADGPAGEPVGPSRPPRG